MKLRSLFIAAVLATWFCRPAQGTTLVRLSLDQLSQASSAVVRGRVVRQESGWNPEHTQIVTLTTISLGQALKGHPPSALVVEQPGGVVGHIRMWVPGVAFLRPQAEYTLFLEPSAAHPSRYLLVGMSQGAFRVYRDAATRQERVILPFGALKAGVQESGAESYLAGPTVPYTEFRRQVGAVVSAPVTVPRGTSIPVVVHTTEFQGAGRLGIEARVTADIFPNAGVVIPAGSSIRGTAQRVAGLWKISWTDLVVRGSRIPLSASSEEPADGSLQGRMLTVLVR